MGELQQLSLASSQLVLEDDMIGFVSTKRSETNFLRNEDSKSAPIRPAIYKTMDPDTGKVTMH